MKTWLCTAAVVIFVLGGVLASAEEFSWQKTYAKISSTGDIEWLPQPFRFEKGNSVRYIDYEGGNDSNDGLTGDTPWKHHPWDPKATGNAKKCKGIHTYIFSHFGDGSRIYFNGCCQIREQHD